VIILLLLRLANKRTHKSIEVVVEASRYCRRGIVKRGLFRSGTDIISLLISLFLLLLGRPSSKKP